MKQSTDGWFWNKFSHTKHFTLTAGSAWTCDRKVRIRKSDVVKNTYWVTIFCGDGEVMENGRLGIKDCYSSLGAAKRAAERACK